MSKIWIFTEGISEENCAKNIIRRNFYGRQILKDLSQFVETENQNVCYIHDCSSVDKIPHEINRFSHLISDDCSVIILCDVEDKICYTNRKNAIIDKLDEGINHEDFNYVFSNTKIEDCYWHCEDQIVEVLNRFHREKFKQSISNINLSSFSKNYSGLKKLFKSKNIKYRESIFSNYFFGRITNFELCDEPTMQRLFGILTELED